MDPYIFLMLMVGFIVLIKFIGHSNEDLSEKIHACAKTKDEKILELEKRLSYLEGIVLGKDVFKPENK